MVLKRFTGGLGSLLNKRPVGVNVDISPDLDTPEANAARGVRLFCESGSANSGEEVLHLPTIVESAVASPSAAAAACAQIRKFLSRENYSRPHVQYNSIMLIRILADNPGQSFTKNMDKGFSDTVKQLLRNGRDPSVNQILRETLEALDREKAYDTNLNALFAMWRKEKGLMAVAQGQQPGLVFGPRTLVAPPWNPNGALQGPPGVSGESYGRNSRPERGLPPPTELVGRIEEARTSAKLLLQLVQSTPPHELLGDELVKEFSERCLAAQRSVQGYINCDNPPPDDDTMLTLIETNEQLSLATSKHQRAVLQARRSLGPTPSPPISATNTISNSPLPALPPTTLPASPPPPPQPPRVEPAVGPPTTFTNREQAPSTGYSIPPLIPLSLQAAPNRQRTASPTASYSDDPFADHHSNSYEALSGPPPPPRDAVRRLSDREQAFQQAREAGGFGTGGATSSSPTSYHPGYTSTPSYLQRQESAGRNVTMHGAVSPPQPQKPDLLTEEEEYARDYPVSNGSKPAIQFADRRAHEENEPQTPAQTRIRPDSEVSPITERGAVTYRY
ncbi:hypothetical protein K432DRAFT_422088 [Lepidopterella palustris CBS 459.81]|uniref:GAT domain-containing protein n=1 Tax=Lepidopterella palustris CBS 459.81 TaxID=1314670 RepID=A0A8E2JK74_9PEZI|nr:hypothetical protein K432DRAFT_422088 [Lepidopterella palustris CBS 459.81]